MLKQACWWLMMLSKSWASTNFNWLLVCKNSFDWLAEQNGYEWASIPWLEALQFACRELFLAGFLFICPDGLFFSFLETANWHFLPQALQLLGVSIVRTHNLVWIWWSMDIDEAFAAIHGWFVKCAWSTSIGREQRYPRLHAWVCCHKNYNCTQVFCDNVHKCT